MKRVYSSLYLHQAAHIENLLRLRGVPCQLRNVNASGAMGEVPFLEAMPEVWVVDDRDEALALRLVEESLREPAEPDRRPPWRCGVCGESVEAQFALCWNCGAEAPP